MRKGGHEQRFYPTAPRLQTSSCLRRGRIPIYLPDALQEICDGSVELLGGFEVREVAGPGNGHVSGAWYLCGHGPHDLGGNDAILLPADDEGWDADLPKERSRVRALPHGAEGGHDAVGGILEDHGPHVLHKLLVVL